jgi:hypothetical protein
MNFKATKAWAGKTHARLGQKQPKMLLIIHLRSMVRRSSRENKTARAGRTPETLAHFFTSSLPPSSPERAIEAAGVATDRRSGAIARLLVGGRRSPEGERAVVEQSRCDALSREPEPVNPRGGVGEHRVPFPDSNKVGSGNGGPKVSPRPLLLARVRDFFTSIRFFLDLIRILFLFMLRERD